MSHARRVPYATSEATAATYAAVAATREPIVWAHSHSFAHQWRARSRWSRDASALGAVVPWVMARLDERGDGEFVLTAPQRGGSSALLHAGPPWEPLQTSTRNVSVAEILSDGAAAQRFYYSGSLHHDAATAHWHADALTADLAPLEPLALLDVPPLLPDDPIQPPAQAGASARPINRTSMRLWLTSGGVLARTHYDKSHNVLCVLHGSKQIVLWPPAELPSLHLYPAVHAAHRQSQVSSLRHATLHAALDARTTDTVHIDTSPTLSLPGVVGDFHLLDAAALLGRGDARSAELTEGTCMYIPPYFPRSHGMPSSPYLPWCHVAGSCMYIPPYWAHLVYSPSASVSLAAFSTSWEQARWARSGWMAAPLGRFQSGGLCTKARGAALLVAAFVHSCAPLLVADGRINGRTPRGFLATLYAARYAPLYGVLHDDAPLGAAVGEHSSSASLAACLAASADHPLPPDAPERDAALRGRVRAFGARMAALLTDADPAAGGRRYERGVALELAADYVEEIAGWACGATGAWRLLRLLAQTEETDVGHVVVVERRP